MFAVLPSATKRCLRTIKPSIEIGESGNLNGSRCPTDIQGTSHVGISEPDHTYLCPLQIGPGWPLPRGPAGVPWPVPRPLATDSSNRTIHWAGVNRSEFKSRFCSLGDHNPVHYIENQCAVYPTSSSASAYGFEELYYLAKKNINKE